MTTAHRTDYSNYWARMERLRRLGMVDENYKTTSRRNKVNYRTHAREVQTKYRAEIEALQTDLMVPNETIRHELIQKKTSEYQRAYGEAVRRAQAALQEDLDRKYKAANPPRPRLAATTANLIHLEERRQRLEDLRYDMEDRPGSILTRYADAAFRGDTLDVEIFEEHGGRFVAKQDRDEFQQAVRQNKLARMPAQQRQASKDFEELVAEKNALEMGWATGRNVVSAEVRNAEGGRPYPDRHEKADKLGLDRGGADGG